MIIRRDRYFARLYPKGPKNCKDELAVGWSKGETPMFLTYTGNPVKRVNLAEFSNICGMKVVAGDLRKLYTTEIAHNPNQVT